MFANLYYATRIIWRNYEFSIGPQLNSSQFWSYFGFLLSKRIWISLGLYILKSSFAVIFIAHCKRVSFHLEDQLLGDIVCIPCKRKALNFHGPEIILRAPYLFIEILRLTCICCSVGTFPLSFINNSCNGLPDEIKVNLSNAFG